MKEAKVKKTKEKTVKAAKEQNTGPVVISVTGSIGSGKSVVGEIAEKAGAFLIDTDFIAKELQAEGREGARQIKAAFGDKYYEAGFLNRKALAREVFTDREKLETLNNIMHPLIHAEMLEKINAAKKEGYGLYLRLCPFCSRRVKAGWDFSTPYGLLPRLRTRV